MRRLTGLSSVLLILISAILINGCGFKLRGAYQLPEAMKLTYVDAPDSAFSRSLKRSLRASNITLLDEKSENAALLKLFKELKNKRIVSVDSKGRAREYTLIYEISFNVQGAGDFSIEDQTVVIERDFVFDTEDVLGNSREESKLYEEMQQDLIRLILMRLQSKAMAG